MDIVVPLTLEAIRLVKQTCLERFNLTPERLYEIFYKDVPHTHIYICSSGDYHFVRESELKNSQAVPVTLEEARKELFIRSLET